jgi:Tfp pilus assembly protein PilO
MTSIEGEPLLIEDLRARRAELRETLASLAHRSTGALSDLKHRVTKRFLSFGYLMRQFTRREEISSMLAAARGEWHTDVEKIYRSA